MAINMNFGHHHNMVSFSQWTTLDQQAAQEAEKKLVNQVNGHLEEAILFGGFGNMGITERKMLSHEDEAPILAALDELKSNSSENVQKVLCDINKKVLPDICRFPKIAEKLKEIAVPIIKSTLDERIPEPKKWNRPITNDVESFENDMEIAAVASMLSERNFPCHGFGELLMNNGVINVDEFEATLSEEKAPIYQALCHIDPMGDACQLGLALCLKPGVQEKDRYLSVKSLLENVVYNGSSDACKDLACAHLSILLQNGTEGCLPDLPEAKRVLQMVIDSAEKAGKVASKSVRALEVLSLSERLKQRGNPYGREDNEEIEQQQRTVGRSRFAGPGGKGGRW